MFGAVSLDIFKEDALLMNSTVVLPLVSKYATINPLLDWPEEGNSLLFFNVLDCDVFNALHCKPVFVSACS